MDSSFICCSGLSESLSLSSGVSSVPVRDAEGPVCCGSGVLSAEEVDGVGDKGPLDATMANIETFLETLGLFNY